MRIRSMNTPCGLAAVPAAVSPLSRATTRAPIAAKVGKDGLLTFRLVGGCFRRREFALARLWFILPAAPRLRLAPPEIPPQRRAQPRLPRRLGPGLGALGHGRKIRDGRTARPRGMAELRPAIHVLGCTLAPRSVQQRPAL